MKKLLFLFCFISFSLCTHAQYTLTESDVTFSDGVITDYINTTEKDIIIPDNFDGVAVTAIGDAVFEENELTGVVIPNSVTSIGEKAFRKNALMNVTIPNSVTSIGERAFAYNELTSLTIPNSIITIESWTFYDNKLTSVTIPNSVTSIGASSLRSNALTSVTIPNSVTYIGSWAFDDNVLTDFILPSPSMEGNWSTGTAGQLVSASTTSHRYLATNYEATAVDFLFQDGQIQDYYGPGGAVTIPSSINGEPVTSVGSWAFDDTYLTSVTIPNSVNSIVDGAFANNQLTSVIIPNSVTTIGEFTFRGNQLTSVTIPNSVTSIGDYSFAYNELTNVTISNLVTVIKEGAFRGNKLTSLVLPNSVISIERYAFVDNNLTSVIIPNSVTSIGQSAFLDNKLTSLILPNSLTDIGRYAFSGNQLTNVVFSKSLVNIGYGAFYENDLNSVALPNSLTSIGAWAFESNQLTSVNLPEHYQGYSYSWSDDENSSYNSGDQVTDLTKEFSIGTKGEAVQFSIDYKLDGGVSTNPATYSVEDATISLNDPSKEEYTFIGWYTDAAFTNTITEITTGSTGDIEVFAKFELISSTIDFKQLDFQFYPNPSNNFIKTDLEIVKLTIYNNQGAIVNQFTKNTNTYDVSNLESGTYLIKASDTDGIVYTSKIVKE